MTLPCLLNSDQGGSAKSTGPPFSLPSGGQSPPLSICVYFLGHGALYVTVTVSPLRNVSSDFTGKPPLGHFFGSVP